MIQRFYSDTSVFGGVFDTEFEEHSVILFEKVKLGQIKVIYSDITKKEINRARKEIRDFFESLPAIGMEFVELTNEAVLLADSYIEAKVVGKSSREDCLHIALATISKAEFW